MLLVLQSRLNDSIIRNVELRKERDAARAEIGTLGTTLTVVRSQLSAQRQIHAELGEWHS